jgi:CDP-glucose 4,6-dehydratase
MEAVGLNRDFWRGRRVFVTGHTGFKGSWLILLLKALGAKIFGFARPAPTEPAMFTLLGLEAHCAHRVGDICDLAALEDALREARPDIVIHMAAQPLVRASYASPVETYAVNLMGTVNLLDASRRLETIPAIVAVTTDKVYENRATGKAYAEEDRLGGHDPYANSKACAELAIDAYRASYFSQARIGLASARAGNVIGGGDFAPDRLVPDAVRAFMQGRSLALRNPLFVRPWQHVLEPLCGYLLLAERLHADPDLGRGWNFGPAPEEDATVRSVVEILAEIWGDGASWRLDEGSHPREAAHLSLDSGRARAELAWRPRFRLAEALRQTAAWYLAWRDGRDMLRFSKEQINSYLS